MGVYIKGMTIPKTCIECMNSGLRTAIRCTEWTKISAGLRENHRSISCHLTEAPEPCEDAVSREDLIERLNGIYGTAELDAVFEIVENMPSAQPEIVRCKDCKYGEQDEVGRWFCRSLGCQIGDEDGSGFCADAERRTDCNGRN